MELPEEYETWKQTQTLKSDYETWKAGEAHQAELAHGGAMRTATDAPFRNPAVGSLVGGTVGALGGLAIGGPGGAMAGGIGGALLGEAAQQGYEYLSGSSAAPRTSEESIRRLAEEATMTGITQLLTPAARVGRLATAPPILEPGAEDAMRFMGKYTKQGFLPAEATKSRVTDIVQNIGEASLFGGGRIKTFKENRDVLFNTIADEYVTQFGARANADEVGRAIVDAAKGNLADKTVPAKMTYQILETAAADATISIQGIKHNADFQKMLRLSQASKGLEERAMGDTLLTYIEQLPDTVSYAVAKDVRTRIRTLQSTLEKGIDTKGSPAIGKAKHLYGQLTDEIRAGLSKTDPFLAEMWDEANFTTAAAQAQFNNRVIRTMVKQSIEEGGNKPEAIANQLVQQNNMTAMRTVMNAVDDPTRQAIRSYTLDRLMQDSMHNGVINGIKLEERMFSRKGVGEASMRTLYTPEQIHTYKQFINALKLAQDKQSEGTGRMLIQLTQGGALMNMGAAALGKSDQFIQESAGILLSPLMISRLMTTPTTANIMIRGLTLPARTELAASLAGSAINALYPRSSKTVVPTTPMNPKHAVSAGPPSMEHHY
jgi:hypothetical protein